MKDRYSRKNRLTIPSLPDQVKIIDSYLEKWLRNRGIPEDTITDLSIAITELVNNAIYHGNRQSSKKSVNVSLGYQNGLFEASVTDEGAGFDPNKLPDPIANENLLKSNGRGLFIVKSLMDEVRFTFPPEGGTIAFITKKITEK